MSDRNDQWSWDGVNAPYGDGDSAQRDEPGSYGAAPSPYGGGPSPYGDDGAPDQQPPQYGQSYGAQSEFGAPGDPQHAYGQPPQSSYGEQLAWAGGNDGPQFMPGDLKPGIISLRPLSFGEFFDGAFRSIQHNPQVMFGLSLVVSVVLSLLQALLLGSAFLRLGADYNVNYPIGVASDTLVALSGGAIVSAIVAMVATIVLNGLLVVSVSQSILGRKVSISEVWKQAKGVIHRLIGITFMVSALTFAGVMISMVIAGIMIGGMASSFSRGGWIAILITVLVAMVLVVGIAALFYIKFGLAAPAAVMERSTAVGSMGRSWRLTKGYFWRNLFVLLLGGIIVGAISGIFSIPLGMLAGWIAGLGSAGVWAAGGITIGVSAIISALTTPFLAALSALLYVDLRMRKEGLDVELIRAASA